jgi:ABC-type polysaccharide/polyol phosphate transport system ATPase subunit
MEKPIIEFNGVTKTFSFQNQKTFKEFLPALFMGEKTHNQFTALNDISFKINRGETIGIIGPNGSGKSTILKLVAGVMSPNQGKVNVDGRVSPLIELGAGMHSELSGRENIFLNASILNLSQKETEKNFNSIVNFAEIEEFVDQPVKHYSTGMYMRLGFAIAVHVNPEILIIDEILAVGDAKFQEKCFEKMEGFKKQGVTILFVSHDINQINKFCTKVIYIRESNLIAIGDPKTISQQYLNDQNKK